MEYLINEQDFSFIIETTKRDLSEEIVDGLVSQRKKKSMTQQDIADLTGIARANIARVENCKCTPTLDVLVKYATALGLKINFEFEELEEQRQGRNKETLVDRAYIESGEYRRKFDCLTDSEELNRLIYSKAKEMLIHRSGTEYEDMYWFDSVEKKVLCYKKDEIVKGEVRHTKSIEAKIRKTQSVIAVHTHPFSMPPSPEDFNCYYQSGYQLGIVICHDGTIYKYQSYKMIDSGLWARYAADDKVQYLDSIEAQKSALNKFADLGDLYFEEVLV